MIVGGNGTGMLLLQGTGRAGRTLVSLHCVLLLENTSYCQCFLSPLRVRPVVYVIPAISVFQTGIKAWYQKSHEQV